MNCASQSCPALAPVPYATASLDAALDNATRAYLASPEGMRADGNGVSVTKLVEWYEADFGGKDGVKAFLLKYGPEKLRPNVNAGIKTHEYGWALNRH